MYSTLNLTDASTLNPILVSLLNMKTLSERLRYALKARSETQVALANACGVTKGAVNQWMSGTVKALEGANLLSAAKFLNVLPQWLQSGEGPMTGTVETRGVFVSANPAPPIGTPIIEWDDPEDLPEGEFVIVPRYDLHVAAGNGHVVYEEMEHEQGQAYRTSSVRKLGTSARNLMTVYAKGESMEPSIYAGDALLVDRGQREVQDRNVYVLRYGHEIRVKRLFKRPDGGLRIVSDNAGAFPEEVVTAAEMEHIEVIGRVVERSGRM